MDRSWMLIEDKLSKTFLDGVNEFMRKAFDYRDKDDKILCPCRRCRNLHPRYVHVVHKHLGEFGFDITYMRWIHHGESVTSGDTCAVGNENRDDNISTRAGDVPYEQEILEDIHDSTFADVPLEDDIGKEDYMQHFDTLLENAKREAYPGCKKYSLLSTIIKLLHIKVLAHWSNRSFDWLLEFLKDFLPDGEILPSSYYEARKLLRGLGLGCEQIHACRNDCVLFRKEHKDLDECPVCKESRWKVTKRRKNKVACKILRYFPLKPRLRRLFASRKTALDMRWHKTYVQEENVMRHPCDSEAWKHFDQQYPWFAADSRNVRLGLASDGFNPSGIMSTSYSIWPVVVFPLNLPPWKCMTDPFIMLTLLIPGPHQPGRDIDVYLQPLIEELKELWEVGDSSYDFVSGNFFQMHGALLWTVNDFPAYADLSGWCTKGYKACPVCNEDGVSKLLRNKICYMGHRRYLPEHHRWRKSMKFDGKHEYRPRPREFSGKDVLAQLLQLRDLPLGKIANNRKRKRAPEERNWTKKSIFFQLSYWSELLIRHNLDVMHIEKNICEYIMWTVLNVKEKTKDTEKAREDLKDMNIRKELHLQRNNGKTVKPVARYTLTTKERRGFCEFLSLLKYPDGYAANLYRCVNVEKGNISGLKTHDCHMLLQCAMPLGLRGFLDDDILAALFDLASFFRELCSKTLKITDIVILEEKIIMILCKLEMIFPPAFFDVMLHLTVHLPQEARLGGPVQYRWMYVIERTLRRYKQFVKNKAYPEGSIAEAYIVNECLTFCSMYLEEVETRFNRPERYRDKSDQRDGCFTIFTTKVRPFGVVSYKSISLLEKKNLHWYALNNCEEVQPFLLKYEREHLAQNPDPGDYKHEFASWFENLMCKLREEGSPDITEDLYSIALGPELRVSSYSGCIVNGVKFLTKLRDMNRMTQNSGLCVSGEHGGKALIFFGVLTDIVELRYINDRRVVLFKCKWFDLQRNKSVDVGMDFKSVNMSKLWYEDDSYILATQAEQVFFVPDTKLKGDWHVAIKVRHRQIYDKTLFTFMDDSDVQDDMACEANAYQEEELMPRALSSDQEELGLLSRDDVVPEKISEISIGEAVAIEDFISNADSNVDITNDNEDQFNSEHEEESSDDEDY